MKIPTNYHASFFFKIMLSAACLSTVHAKDLAKENAEEALASTAVKELETYADYAKMMSNSEPSIIMVHATWCGACKQFKPTFSKIAEKYKKDAHFYTLNEANKEMEKELAAFGIQGFPTIMYIKKDLGGANDIIFDAKVRDFLGIKQPMPEIKTVEKKEKEKEAPIKSAVKEIKTKHEYHEMLKNKKPTALLLYATWCGACSMFKPMYHEMSQKRPDVQFYMLDVDNDELNKEIAAFNVTGIPTTLFFKHNGKALTQEHQMIGARPTIEIFEQEIDSFLKAKKAPVKKEPVKKEMHKKHHNKHHKKEHIQS